MSMMREAQTEAVEVMLVNLLMAGLEVAPVLVLGSSSTRKALLCSISS